MRSKNDVFRAGFAAFAALSVALCVSGAFAQDGAKKITVESPKSVDAKPDYENGVGINFSELYSLQQAADFPAPEENGWALILQALGPRALEYVACADKIPWENFPTDKATKEWFEDFWTPACEKLGLDPKAKPTMLDDLGIYSWLVKYGITGKETPPDSSDASEYKYWEKNEQKVGLSSLSEANDCYMRIMGKPWTAEEFPTAAKWLEERAELFDIFAQAARRPYLRMWRRCDDKPFGMVGLLLPDVQYTREIARLLQIRAKYRLGSGDVDGAIDDVETMLLIGKRALENKNSVMVERLVGMAIISIAAGVGLEACEKAAPSSEGYARLLKMWRDFAADVDLKAVVDATVRYEYEFFMTATAQDFAVLIQNGDMKSLKEIMEFADLTSDDPPELETLFALIDPESSKESALKADELDMRIFIREFRSFYEQTLDAASKGEPFSADVDENSPVEKKLAADFFNLMSGYPFVAASYSAFNRLVCVTNLKQLGFALLAYQAEHGALPPAFTVDASGKPLHSWRVLVLPYLGDDAKALFDKIRLDEPWDSDYNKQFHGQIPNVFRCPVDGAADKTPYSVILGGNGPFDASGKGKNVRELRKQNGVETNVLAMVVERLEPVCWMKPDAELTAQDCLEAAGGKGNAAFGGRHSEGVNYCDAAGGIHFLSIYSETQVKAAIEGKAPAEDQE